MKNPLFVILFLAMSYYHAAAITIDVTAFGADKTGRRSSTEALRAVSKRVNALPRNVTKKIVFPKGKYLLYTNNFTDRSPQFFLSLKNQNKIIVEGNNSELFFPDSLYFGSFENINGILVPTTGVNTRPTTGHSIGKMVSFFNCNKCTVQNINLNGNCDTYKYGGQWGDKGIQLVSYGLELVGCSNSLVSNVQSHHFGTDGLLLANSGRDCNYISIRKSNFNYNCRQGLSLTSGTNINVDKCTFNYTGTFYQNAPCSGIDLESESSGLINNVLIQNSEIKNNGVIGVISFNPGNKILPVRNVNFLNCTLVSKSEFVLEAGNENFKFYSCNIIGTVLGGVKTNNLSKSTKFFNCVFSEGVNDSIPFFTFNKIYNFKAAGKNYYKNCSFEANNPAARCINFGQNIAYPPNDIVDSSYFSVYDNCSFSSNTLKMFKGDYYATNINGVHFLGMNSWLITKPKKVNTALAHIYLDNVVMHEASKLRFASESTRFIFRQKNEMKGNGVGSVIVVESGNEFVLQEGSLFIRPKSSIVVKPGGKLVVANGFVVENDGIIQIDKGGLFTNSSGRQIRNVVNLN